MADDISKKITVDIGVNPDALQQIDQYKASFDNLRTSIINLGKPLTDITTNINSLNKPLADMTTNIGNANKPLADMATNISNVGKALAKTGSSMDSFAAKSTAATIATTKTQVAATQDTEEKKSRTIVGSAIATAAKLLGITRITNKKTAALTTEQLAAQRKAEIASAQTISDSVFSIVTKGIEQRSDATVRGLEADRKTIDKNTSLAAADKTRLENNIYIQEDAAKLKAFKNGQKAGIAQAIINGAVAVTKSEADLGPIAGTLALGAIVAQTAAQVATIERQQPPAKLAMAKGGFFRSDGKGAVLPGYSRTDDTNAFLRSGEAVVVSEAMRDPWARNLVSAINTAYGGRSFAVPNLNRGYAVGGIFTDGGNANRYYNQPVNDQKNLANTVAYQMINNFPPVYVDVKDINNQQNIMAQTINRVNL